MTCARMIERYHCDEVINIGVAGGIKKYEDLPKACRDYVEEIERLIETPITMVSNGPGRDEIIKR